MIRTTLIPTENNIVLEVPEYYIGKTIEVLIFDTAEIHHKESEVSSPLKPSQLRGFLSQDSAKSLQQHIGQSRTEWDTL